MTQEHDSNACAAVPHTYWTYMVVWCSHRQQFTVTSGAYVEEGTAGDPRDYRTRRLELGPFDTSSDARDALVRWLNEDLQH